MFRKEFQAMRDLEAYAQHGRNNPHHPDQMREHPYDFVSLPETPKTVKAPGHDSYHPQLYSGVLTLIYQILTPLHLGSGSFEGSQACGLLGKDQPVRGIMRRAGRAILPGSGWKGAVRARYEAITRSRLALAKDYHKQFPEKVPGPLRVHASRPHEVRLQDPRLRALQARTVKHQDRPEDNRRQLQSLSPAESLFGAMGYRGRVHPGDGLIETPSPGEPGTPLQIAPMESPSAHRLAKPGQAVNGPGVSIEIREVEGRKFYYDGDIITARNTTSHGEVHAFTHELVDYVPAGSLITLEVHLEAVDLPELGALLISAGYGSEVGILRFGGFKPSGLGKVELCETRTQLRPGAATRSWKRPAPVALDLEQAIQAAQKMLIDPDALRELHTVTTMRRP
jgi:CRISPR/Cas system CSM-associated protein Csm3 (group 7 of RAMP superfamily)